MSTVMVSSTLVAERDSISNATNWAGALNLCENLSWIKDGTHTRLVWKRDIASSLNLAHVANRFNYVNVPNAQLAMVVQLTENDFWMMADSGWRGPTKLAPTFADIDLTCTAGAPPLDELQDDYRDIFVNMQDIVRLSGDVQSTGKGFLIKENGEKKIILHHAPFIVRSPPQFTAPHKANDINSGRQIPICQEASQPVCYESITLSISHISLFIPLTYIPTAFEMEISEWPANSYEARQAKQHMRHTHIAQPLPATDSRGRVIHPAEYESFLRGCTAVVWFSVHKHTLTDCDSYRARIEMIRTVTLPDLRSRTIGGRKQEVVGERKDN